MQENNERVSIAESVPRLMAPDNTVKSNAKLLEVNILMEYLQELYSNASNLLIELKKEIELLKEQIATMEKMIDEQAKDVYESLTPRITSSFDTLDAEMQKEKKENAKLEYQVNELTEEKNRLCELVKAFYDRVQYLNDFIGG